MKKLIAVLAFAVLIASPALAQSPNRGPAKPFLHPAPWLFGIYAQSPPSATVSRETAIQECNADARGYSQIPDGHQELDRYRCCMARHGHME